MTNHPSFDLNDFIKNALAEDVGDGDHTSLSCIDSSAEGKAQLIVKDEGVIAGVELANLIFKTIDPTITIEVKLADSSFVTNGDIALLVKGKVHSILKAERLVLNCIQRMSGIATKTNRLVQKLNGLKTKLLDTRKTTPGFRMLEKWAVQIGGGVNHRFGLFDMILIKDNHVDYVGGIKQAIASANKYIKEKNKKLKIEIEVRNMNELKEVLEVGSVDRIMLDNFSLVDLKKAVELIDGKFETEASGKITEENIRQYAECGVDYISVGALTHSYKSLDMSLKAVR